MSNVVRFALSLHASREMSRRSVPLHLLEEVLNNPQQVVSGHGVKKIYQSQIVLGDGRIFLLRVIVADDTNPPTVVTVYRTRKVSKYWSSS